MPLIKKSTGLLKEFVNSANGEQYSFIFVPDPEDPTLASTHTFDDEEEVRKRFWYPNIHKDDIIFDVGAAFGSYTLPALAMGASVFAFSPEHENQKIIKSIRANSNQGFTERCMLYNYGFYSDTGLFKTDSMAFFKIGQMSDKEIRRVNDNNFCGWYIPVRRLDDFELLEDIDKIDFIKIDAEGAELHILNGGIKTLNKYKPKLLIEFHVFKNMDIEKQTVRFLSELGYVFAGRTQSDVKGLINVSHGFFTHP